MGKQERRRGRRWESGMYEELEESIGHKEQMLNRIASLQRVKKVQERGEKVRRVGTGVVAGGRRKSVDDKAQGKREGVVVVTEDWVNGRLTNHSVFRAYVKRVEKGTGVEGGGVRKTKAKEQRWYEEHRKGREGWLGSSGVQGGRPGVRVYLNTPETPSEMVAGRVARREALRCGVPTVGRVGVPEKSGITEMGEAREQLEENRRTYARRWARSERGRLRFVNRRRCERSAKD